MKQFTLVLLFTLFSYLSAISQEANIQIDLQILNYDGVSEFQYFLEKGNYTRNPQKAKLDENGRVSIIKNINELSYFWFYYRNNNDNSIFHRCRLIVEPNKHYSVISKGNRTIVQDNAIVTEIKYYSPDIYSWNYNTNDFGNTLKMDYSQMYYNMFDDDTQGSLYSADWKLNQPDSLINTLQKRIEIRKDLYKESLSKGEITSDFYEIVSANIEYNLAYQLAQTISDIWQFDRLKIDDQNINQALSEVYDSIFTLFPVSDDRLSLVQHSFRFVNTYLYNYEAKKKGSHTAPKKGSYKNYIDEIRPFIHKQVYIDYKMQHSMTMVANLRLESSKEAQKFLSEHEDMKNTQWGILTENELIPRSLYFDSLANRPMNSEIVILDEDTSIQNFVQLIDRLEGKAFYLDIWGTWCGPCRQMFQYKDSISEFLKQNEIEMVYAAYEYSNNRDNWKKIIVAYDLKGYHLIMTDQLKKDIEKISGNIEGFPTYMIVNKDGEIVENKAFSPIAGSKLRLQISSKLN